MHYWSLHGVIAVHKQIALMMMMMMMMMMESLVGDDPRDSLVMMVMTVEMSIGPTPYTSTLHRVSKPRTRQSTSWR